MKRAAFHNLGCKVNAYETDVMIQALQSDGYEIVPFDRPADVYVVNTCTVTNIADRKSRQMLHRAKKQNPAAIVVAAGCYVETDRAGVQKDPSVDIAIGNAQKARLAEVLREYLTARGECPYADAADGGGSCLSGGESAERIGAAAASSEMKLSRPPARTRAFIKIQDGCNQFCSYCIIPYARGRVRSRSIGDIVRETEGLAAEGCREIVLTGIHLSSYGAEQGSAGDASGKGIALLSLVEALHGLSGIERIRLGSLEPRLITRDFAARAKLLPKLCPHFHISLQSGCDTVLKRMNRHYTTKDYQASVAFLREVYDAPAITTDVIVGFPGETEEEFETGRRFIAQMDFYETHVFKYSVRRGTAAEKMASQVEEPVKRARSEILIALSAEHARRYRMRFLSDTGEVDFMPEREEMPRTEEAGARPELGKTPHTGEAEDRPEPGKTPRMGEAEDRPEQGKMPCAEEAGFTPKRGKTLRVLWEDMEEIKGKRYLTGHTERYIRAAWAADAFAAETVYADEGAGGNILPRTDIAGTPAGTITEGRAIAFLTPDTLLFAPGRAYSG